MGRFDEDIENERLRVFATNFAFPCRTWLNLAKRDSTSSNDDSVCFCHPRKVLTGPHFSLKDNRGFFDHRVVLSLQQHPHIDPHLSSMMSENPGFGKRRRSNYEAHTVF